MKIYKVRATGLSSELGLKIRELGRIAVKGQVFTVQELRYKFLAGDNPYKKPFVELASNQLVTINHNREIEPVVKTVNNNAVTFDFSSNNTTTNTTDLPINDKVIYPKENPEVIVIEPGKEPTKYTLDEYNELIKKEEELVAEKTPVNKSEEKKTMIEEIKTKSKQRRAKRANKTKDTTKEESSEY